MNSHRAIGHNLFFMLLGNVLSSLLGAVRQIILARFFTPAEFGVWNLLNLVLSYANYADIGTNSGMLYRSSALIGEGNAAESVRVREQALLFTLILSSGLCAVFLAISMLPDHIIGPYGTVLFFVGIAIPIFLLLNYFHVEARVRDSFRLLGIATILGAVACLILTVLATFVVGTNRVDAMVMAWLSGTVLMLVYLASHLRVQFARELDWNSVWRLIRIGLPLTTIPIAYVLFQSVDRWVIVGAVSPTEFGYYAFGTTIGIMLSMLPNTLGVVLSTRLIERFARTKKPQNSSVMVLVSLWVSAYAMAFISGGIVLIMPYLLTYYFPQFLPGENVITTLIIANSLLFSMPITSSFLLANERKRLLLVTLCFATAGESILVFMAQRADGIQGAAYAVLSCAALLAMYMVIASISLLQGKFGWQIKRISALFLPFVACLAVAAFVAGPRPIGVPAVDALFIIKSCALYITCGCFICGLIAWIGGVTGDIPIRWKRV